MEKVIAKPQLSFSEALKLATSRITQLSGRSRRSEFWWAVLVFFVCIYIVNAILALVLPLQVSEVVGHLLMLIALPLTVRRLQDVGRSKWWVIIAWVASLIGSVYIVQSGIIDAITSVNADPDAVLQSFTDPVLVVSGLVQTVAGLATFVFCLIDSKPYENKYGLSPKYDAVVE